MAELFVNDVSTALAAGVTASAAAITVTSATGLPSPTGTDFAQIRLEPNVPDGTFELVKMTARSGTTLTVTRAQEGTTGVAWPAGSKVSLVVTAETLTTMQSGISSSLVVVVYSGSLTTARPSATVVMWENFPSQPTNMVDGDIWVDPTTGGVLLSGTAAPTGGVGNDGDFYIRTTTSFLYGPKAAGAWPAGVSLVGAAGTNGTGVPTGGTTGQVLAKNSATNFDTGWATSAGGGYIPDSDYRLPTGGIAATFDRGTSTGANLTIASGTLYLTAVVLRAGTVVTNLNCFVGSTQITTVTHSWMALCDINRVVLRRSADDTSTPVGTSVQVTFPLSSTYTITTTGLYLLGTMFACAGGQLYGQSNLGVGLQIAPKLHGTSSTGQTTPPAEGATMGTMNSAPTPVYAWVT